MESSSNFEVDDGKRQKIIRETLRFVYRGLGHSTDKQADDEVLHPPNSRWAGNGGIMWDVAEIPTIRQSLGDISASRSNNS